jgi:hypothetical protein
MNHQQRLIIVSAAALAISGCGASASSPTANKNVANVAADSLQFAVGTAVLATGGTALNVVATYRQPAGGFHPGDSATLTNSPVITLPSAITVAAGTPSDYDACSTVLTGPSAAEIGGTAIASNGQAASAATTPATSFGQSGGVFGLGIEPYNAQGQADCTPPGPAGSGQPFQVAPYPVPLYDAAAATDVNAFVPWGGPPAFQLQGSQGQSVVGNPDYPSGTAGIGEGIDVFASLAPVVGTYTLSVTVPANNATVTQSKTATLAAVKVLGAATAPAFVPDAAVDGGGTLAFVLPALATEAYVQVVDYGPAAGTGCNPASADAPLYYTFEATASGAITVPAALGPGGSPTTCAGDQVVTQVIGFDYDLYGASYPNSNGVPSPTQINAQATDDLTISPAVCTIVGGGSCDGALPLLRHRNIGPADVLRSKAIHRH